MTDETIKVYTPKQLNDLTSGGLSISNLQGFQKIITTATGFAKELNSMLINYQSVKGTYDKIKNPEQQQIPQVNVNAKIEKGIDKAISKLPEPTILYEIDGATKTFKEFIQGIFNNLDDDKTIKECREEIDKSFDIEQLKPIVKAFLENHTSAVI